MKVATAITFFLTNGLREGKFVFEKRTHSVESDIAVELSKPGYYRARDIVVRKSVRNLSHSELSYLRHAYRAMMVRKDHGYYRYLAGIHGIPDFKSKYGMVIPDFSYFGIVHTFIGLKNTFRMQ
jgi:hypothetical protein